MLKTEELLKDLTDEQREAATHVDGPLLIIAGAGSGKTRVITRRVAYLMGLGIPPAAILAITFTNKAAGEMKSRVSDLLGRPLRDFGRLDQPWPILCTFHSLGLRILKHYAPRIGLAPNFSVYDGSDQDRVVKEAMKAADLATEQFQPAAVHAAISNAKNKLISAEAYAKSALAFPESRYARAYKHYQAILNQNHALDFDDLLMRTAFMFRQHQDILKELQERFQYILIDEYQDTNHAQYVMAHAMALGHSNICVVGDPDQSIYAWRGADIHNILDFEKDYPKAKVVKLEQNYRSTQTILDIASAVISNNRQRKEKRLWTEKGAGSKAQVFICPDEEDEADAITDRLQELKDKGYNWGQMAIFYRINALSRVLEDSLRREGVPYRIARGVDFYHRKEIKDVLAYLRALANPDDELSLSRIVNVPPRGIGDTSVKQMQAHALNQGWNLWQTLQNVGQIPGVASRTSKAAGLFVHLMGRWREMIGRKGKVRDLMEDVVKHSGLEAYYRKAGGTEQAEVANINELITAASQFDEENPEGTLEEYLGQVSLVSDVDTLKEAGGAVTLMTLHAAKGLEFPVVAIAGLEEQILPHARVREHPEQVEEERRLCFVGITRAQEHLILTRTRVRFFRGQRLPTVASRFLAEMPAKLLEVQDSGGVGYSADMAEEEMRSARAGQFHEGQRVRHPVFGSGEIVSLSPMGQQTRAQVQFDRAGRKTLIVEYARLEAE